MEASRSELLGALASDAALERNDFLASATDQLKRFLDANADADLGARWDDPHRRGPGLPVDRAGPDLPESNSLSRRRDRRVGQRDRGHRDRRRARRAVQPGRRLCGVREAAREAAGLPPEPTASEDLLETARIPATDAVGLDAAYAAAADQWAAGESVAEEPPDEQTAAQRLYDLALTFQERSQRDEARLLEDFADVSIRLSEKLGDVVVVDDDDERLLLKAGAGFRAEVVPDDAEGEWRNLLTADAIVEFYDPTDVFGDLADALAEAFPSVAPEAEGGEEAGGEDDRRDEDEDEDEDQDAAEDEDRDEVRAGDDGTGDRDRA